MGVDEGVAMRASAEVCFDLISSTPPPPVPLPKPCPPRRRAPRRLAVGAVQAVGGLALDGAHGFGADRRETRARRRPRWVDRRGSACTPCSCAETAWSYRCPSRRAARPCSRCPRVEALGAFLSGRCARRGVLRLGHCRHVQRQASTPDARGKPRGREDEVDDERGSRKHVESLGRERRAPSCRRGRRGDQWTTCRSDQFVTWRWGGVLFPN